MTTRSACLVDAVHFLGPYDREEARLAERGISLRVCYADSPQAVVEGAQGAEIVMSYWHPFSRETLAALPDCRLVLRAAVGYDNIDLAAATDLGIAVAHSPEYCTEDVADHAAALILASLRRLPQVDRLMRDGGWPVEEYRPFHRVQAQTLGFVGFGRIGQAVARKLAGFEMRVLAYDPYLTTEVVQARGATSVDLNTLLAEADVISVHVPLSAETRGLIGEDALRRMKPTAFLVNTSRGPVVDEAALVRALTEGRLAGAALDVFEREPLAPASPLRSLPNTLLSSHMAAYSLDARDDIRHEMCDTASEWFETGWARKVVNPQVRERLRR
ncbi:MAG: C-terminal binding protein [Anaerolineae bacterium]|nr:C-terminal binding protein [Anaerolineae bacterium]